MVVWLLLDSYVFVCVLFVVGFLVCVGLFGVIVDFGLRVWLFWLFRVGMVFCFTVS